LYWHTSQYKLNKWMQFVIWTYYFILFGATMKVQLVTLV
jgi:hypothetical protein